MHVFTNGCFYILHRGHVQYLSWAACHGRLTVGLNSDASVRRLKPGRPINTESDRAFVLRALRCVDNVVMFEEDTATELVLRLRPDIYVKGGDYSMNTPEAKAVRSYGGSVVSAPFLGGYSTTALIERLR